MNKKRIYITSLLLTIPIYLFGQFEFELKARLNEPISYQLSVDRFASITDSVIYIVLKNPSSSASTFRFQDNSDIIQTETKIADKVQFNLSNSDEFWYYCLLKNKGKFLSYKDNQKRLENNQIINSYIQEIEKNNSVLVDYSLSNYLNIIYKETAYDLKVDKRYFNLKILIIKDIIPRIYCFSNGITLISTGQLATLSNEAELKTLLFNSLYRLFTDQTYKNQKKTESYNKFLDVSEKAINYSIYNVQLVNNIYLKKAINNLTGHIRNQINDDLLRTFGLIYSKNQLETADYYTVEYSNFLFNDSNIFYSILQKNIEYISKRNDIPVQFLNEYKYRNANKNIVESHIDSIFIKKLNTIFSYNGFYEFEYERYDLAIKFIDLNIKYHTASSQDYLIKAIALFNTSVDIEISNEVIRLLKISERLSVNENPLIYKNIGLAYLRLNNNANAKLYFNKYKDLLFEMKLEAPIYNKEKEWLENTISRL